MQANHSASYEGDDAWRHFEYSEHSDDIRELCVVCTIKSRDE